MRYCGKRKASQLIEEMNNNWSLICRNCGQSYEFTCDLQAPKTNLLLSGAAVVDVLLSSPQKSIR